MQNVVCLIMYRHVSAWMGILEILRFLAIYHHQVCIFSPFVLRTDNARDPSYSSFLLLNFSVSLNLLLIKFIEFILN